MPPARKRWPTTMASTITSAAVRDTETIAAALKRTVPPEMRGRHPQNDGNQRNQSRNGQRPPPSRERPADDRSRTSSLSSRRAGFVARPDATARPAAIAGVRGCGVLMLLSGPTSSGATTRLKAEPELLRRSLWRSFFQERQMDSCGGGSSRNRLVSNVAPGSAGTREARDDVAHRCAASGRCRDACQMPAIRPILAGRPSGPAPCSPGKNDGVRGCRVPGTARTAFRTCALFSREERWSPRVPGARNGPGGGRNGPGGGRNGPGGGRNGPAGRGAARNGPERP